jgi:hypothetical protein
MNSDLKEHAMIRCLLVIIALLLGYLPAAAVTVPERLEFDISWTGIKAGTAVQEIIRDGANLKIISTARSTEWLSKIFTVEDRIETLLTPSTVTQLGLPRTYRMKVQEGRHRRDKEITFNHVAGKAVYQDHLSGETKELAITPTTVDIYTSFYMVRGMKLEPGKSVYVDILDSKKQWRVEVQVLRRETVKTKLGEFRTILIKPLLKSEGIFDQKGELLVWLTDDSRHVPIKMKSKVIVGSVTATLVKGL